MPFYDQSSLVKNSINTVKGALGLGLILGHVRSMTRRSKSSAVKRMCQDVDALRSASFARSGTRDMFPAVDFSTLEDPAIAIDAAIITAGIDWASEQICEGDDGEDEHQEDAVLVVLKQAALAVRAEAGAHGEEVRIAQGALPVGSVVWQRSLWRRDVAAYIDVLPLSSTRI